MKSAIHPKYFPNAIISCACGNIIKTGSTREKLEIEICSKCHPFYTGKAKMIDAAGRVERFRERLKKKTPAAGKKKRRV